MTLDPRGYAMILILNVTLPIKTFQPFSHILPVEAFRDPKGNLIASSHYEVQSMSPQEVQLNIQFKVW